MSDRHPMSVHGVQSAVNHSQSLNGILDTLVTTVRMFMPIAVSHPSVSSLGGQREIGVRRSAISWHVGQALQRTPRLRRRG